MSPSSHSLPRTDLQRAGRPSWRRGHPGSSRRRRTEGFTLIELMVIVLIVMSLTALLAPSAVRAFAIFRAQSASLEVLRMARIARREALESGRAIVVRSVGTRVEVRRGTMNLCRTSNWVAQFADPCTTVADIGIAGSSCIGLVDAAWFDVGSHSVTVTPLDGQDICYQPNGEAFLAPSGGTIFRRATISAIRFAVRRVESGTSVDPVRTIIFPVDSSPRSVR